LGSSEEFGVVDSKVYVIDQESPATAPFHGAGSGDDGSWAIDDTTPVNLNVIRSAFADPTTRNRAMAAAATPTALL
jgi:hypothetical protein